MSTQRETVDEIVKIARELDGRDRADYLRDVTEGDPQLRSKVEAALGGKPVEPSRADATTLDARTNGPVFTPAEGAATDDELPTDQDAGLPAALRNDLFKLTEQPGAMVGRYKLLQKIGEGGFGAVYMAEQEHPVKRRVALKIIKAGMDTRQVIARFEAERQALAMMDHPYIAKVLDAGATDTGRPYFVMELVKGIPITQYCDEAKLGTRERLELFKDICSAIQHAHHKGIIHRDLKPSNVMVTLHGGDPVVKVIDFGIAKATDQKLTEKTLFTNYGQMIGTPAYMSPEQAVMSGLDVDTRSDIYSLGVLLYELLAGSPPLDDKTLREAGFDEMRRMIREQDPPKPSTRLSTMAENERLSIADNRHCNPSSLRKQLSGDLDWIVMKALEKDRARRYESASAFAADIDRFLKAEPVEAAAPTTAYRLRKYVQRHKGPVAVAAVIALLLVSGTAVSTWQAVRATNAEIDARRSLDTAEKERDRATRAEQLAVQRLEQVRTERDAKEKAAADAEAIASFFSDVLRSPDPRRDGRTITVVETLDRAAERLELDLADQPERRARLRGVLGNTYSGLGVFNQAITALEQAREYFEADLGAGHPDTLSITEMLALAYHEAGRRDEASRLREQVLEERRAALGPNNPDTLRAMSNLANSYFEAGRLDEALEMRIQVQQLSEELLGPEDPDSLVAMTNLANSYHRSGREDEALIIRQRVATLYQKTAGYRHPDTIKAMSNLANSYFAAGRSDQALAIRERVADLGVEVLGEKHPDTFTALSNLAISYHNAGRYEEASRLRKRVLDLSRAINGPDDPRTLAAMHNLAVSYHANGQTLEALKLREEVYAVFKLVMGKSHSNTLKAMHNLANSYQDMGRWDEALTLRRELLGICDAAYGKQSERTLWAMDSLATTLGEHGQTSDAIQVLQQANALHPDDMPIAIKLAALYAWLDREDDYDRLRNQIFARLPGLKDDHDTHLAVNLVCLRPIGDELSKEVLGIMQKAMPSADTSGGSDPDRVFALALAGYRGSDYARAADHFKLASDLSARAEDEALAQLAVTAQFYRALCYRRLGQDGFALDLSDQAMSGMKPLPEDPAKPLAGVADYAALMQWLAYREATAERR